MIFRWCGVRKSCIFVVSFPYHSISMLVYWRVNVWRASWKTRLKKNSTTRMARLRFLIFWNGPTTSFVVFWNGSFWRGWGGWAVECLDHFGSTFFEKWIYIFWKAEVSEVERFLRLAPSELFATEAQTCPRGRAAFFGPSTTWENHADVPCCRWHLVRKWWTGGHLLWPFSGKSGNRTSKCHKPQVRMWNSVCH